VSLDSTPTARPEEPVDVERLEQEHRTRFWVLLIAVCAIVVLLVGITVGMLRNGSGGDSGPGAAIELGQPVEMPAVTLTDTDGRPYDLAAESEGRVTLLYFGYLECPDACPIHMAVLSKVMEAMPGEVREAVDVVFVTTDPDRDSPGQIREYLDRFDPSFIGLTGDPDTLVDAQIAAGVPVAVAEPADEDGDYLVGHATQVLVFDREGVARVVYPFGVRQSDWMEDLPAIVAENS
jgi:protein SCO1/2